MTSADMLSKLVAFNTVADKEVPALIAWASTLLRGLGATVEVIGTGDTLSLWARLGPEGKGGVALSGHIDVVPTEGQVWATDPFALTLRDGKWYGRGACDMKAFVACVLTYVQRIKVSDLRHPLYIALTSDEELNMTGVRQLSAWLAERGIKPDLVWIGEPTEMRVVNAHKGITAYKTEIKGRAAHASNPGKGCSAVHLAAKLIDALLVHQCPSYEASPFDPPCSNFSVGIVHGGTAGNIVPDTCTIVWQTRIHPGDSQTLGLDFANAKCQALLQEVHTACPEANMTSEATFSLPPFMNKASEKTDAWMMTLAQTDKMDVVLYATEAAYFNQLGVPCYVCGPGSIEQAHKPDEFVAQTQLDLCDAALDRLSPFLMQD